MKTNYLRKAMAVIISLCMTLITASGVLAATEWAVTVNSVDTAANTASVTINTAGDYTAYIAVYETNGTLTSVESAKVTGTTVSFDGSLSFDDQTQTLRCYVWDDNLTPVSAVYEEGAKQVEEAKATFVTDGHASVTASTTKKFDDETTLTYNASIAYPNGDDQINFMVLLDDGYVIDTITATPDTSYNKFSDPTTLGAENTYRLTKVTGAITVTITTKLSDGSETAVDDGTTAAEERGDIVLADTGITSGVAEEYAAVSDDGSTVTILYSGTYNISGSMSAGKIAVAASSNAVVNLNLTDVAIDNSSSTLTPFYAEGAKVNLVLSGTNTFTDSASNKKKACVYSQKDLSIKSADESNKATITVNANRSNGIRCEKDLEIGSVNVNVTAVNNGLKGDKSVKLTKKAGDITIVTTGDGDGIKSDLAPSTDTSTDTTTGGTVTINGGNINITTGSVTDEATGEVSTGDGIQADMLLTIANNPTITINAKGEALKANASSIAHLEDTTGATAATPAEGDGCIKITGGTLTLTAGEDGIKAAKDVTISGGTVTVTKSADGIQAGDIYILTSNPSNSSRIDGAVTISGGTVNVTASEDGVTTTRTYNQSGGSVTIVAALDGVQAGKAYTAKDIGTGSDDETAVYETNGVVNVTDGTLNITANGGAPETINTSGDANQTKVDYSCKGIKARRLIDISGGTLDINSYDDTIHSNHTARITGGEITAASGDDGIHGESYLYISDDADINVTQSYEGIEGARIYISGGKTRVVAADDGANGSGTDPGDNNAYTISNVYDTLATTSEITIMAPPDKPDQGGGSWGGGPEHGGGSGSGGSSYGYIEISGGLLYIEAEGDGFDSNGDAVITGGTVLVNGPTSGGNGILDIGDNSNTLKITGGTVIGAGGSDMKLSATSGTMNYYVYPTISNCSAGTAIQVTDSAGNVIATYKPSKSYACVFVCTPQITSGTYNVYYGGSVTGGTVTGNKAGTYGLVTGGTYTGSTKTSATASNSVLYENMGGGGGR